MTQKQFEGKPCEQCQKNLLPYCVCDHPDIEGPITRTQLLQHSAYREGEVAAQHDRDNSTKTDCPHLERTNAAVAWELGYTDWTDTFNDGLDDLDYDGKTTEEIFAEMPWTEADEAALEQYEEDRRRRIAEQNEY